MYVALCRVSQHVVRVPLVVRGRLAGGTQKVITCVPSYVIIMYFIKDSGTHNAQMKGT